MAVTLFPDGVPCALQEAFDLSFLRQWGKVFRVFDQEDSGNLCFGLEDETHRYFVKFAGARPVRYKAGAYGIQGDGALLVKGIRGDYYTVMGLPVARLYRVLSELKMI